MLQGCSHLRGRRAGSSLHLDVNIEVGYYYFLHFLLYLSFHRFCLVESVTYYLTWQVDPFFSVSAAHEVEENVRDEILKSHPEVAEVFFHIGKNNFVV